MDRGEEEEIDEEEEERRGFVITRRKGGGQSAIKLLDPPLDRARGRSKRPPRYLHPF